HPRHSDPVAVQGRARSGTAGGRCRQVGSCADGRSARRRRKAFLVARPRVYNRGRASCRSSAWVIPIASWHGLQPLRRYGLLTRETNAKIPRLHAVQSFFHQAKLSVIQTVQPERDEFVVRELRLIFLSYPAHFGNRVELDPQTGDHLLPFLEEHLAIRLC